MLIPNIGVQLKLLLEYDLRSWDVWGRLEKKRKMRMLQIEFNQSTDRRLSNEFINRKNIRKLSLKRALLLFFNCHNMGIVVLCVNNDVWRTRFMTSSVSLTGSLSLIQKVTVTFTKAYSLLQCDCSLCRDSHTHTHHVYKTCSFSLHAPIQWIWLKAIPSYWFFLIKSKSRHEKETM